MCAAILGALFFSVAANAQASFTLDTNVLLESEAGEYWENGVGSPSVVYDPDQELYVMFFETRLTDPDSECLWGSWGVGFATSENGIDEWEVWPDPLMAPGGEPYASCVIAHPTALLEEDVYKVWFKAHQNVSACDGGDLPWGCDSLSGVGFGTGQLRLRVPTDMREVLAQDLAENSANQLVSNEAFHAILEDYLDLVTHHGDLEDTWHDIKHADDDWKDLLHDLKHAIQDAEKNLGKHLGITGSAGGSKAKSSKGSKCRVVCICS